jgi:phospholipase C
MARLSILTLATCVAAAMPAISATGVLAADPQGTATPIKHLIVIIGENRSFDHLFGLYTPKPGQTVSNILSKGIVNADGTPGPHFADAAQFAAAPGVTYFIATDAKAPYTTLPPADLGYTPQKGTDANPVPVPGLGFDDPAPFLTPAKAASEEPDLAPGDIPLLVTGATGLSTTKGPDTRLANVMALPNGPFPITGPALPYDSYTGDTIHRFFQMWQQSDCNPTKTDAANPSGCRNDLYPWVSVTSQKNVYGGAWSMGFYNMGAGDAPYLKQLADTYALADNYHQPAMGGTGIQHIYLGFGDAMYYSDAKGKPVVPQKQVADPNPEMQTQGPRAAKYRVDGTYTACADPNQPGVAAITDYLAALHPAVRTRCEPDHYYLINNVDPAYEPDGKLDHESAEAHFHFVPPSRMRHIGDALTERGISFAYYGGGYAAAVAKKPNTYCNICNPFEYASSIMASPAKRHEHLRDVQDLLAEIKSEKLPAVAYVKPDGWLDGHPATSKVDLFEAFTRNIISRLQADPKLFAETAVVITFDEGGGYWDSGYIQPLDFFGDGPRIPTIVVSPYSTGGKVVHAYYDHVSVLKFIERNWGLPPLTQRSRDRLPNPKANAANPYVPVNGPAIGDLFEMFDFKKAK